MHYPIGQYYFRRIRVGKHSELLEPLIDAGYHIEEAVGDPTTMVVR